MSEEIGKLYLELPGDDVSGTGSQKNLVMLHEHRDLILKIELPKPRPLRLISPQKPFYDPQKKRQTSEYVFAPGQEIHLWLSKFHQTGLELQQQTENGWMPYLDITPKLYDGADYSSLIARPAPIVFKVGPQGNPIGEIIKFSGKNANIPSEYQNDLQEFHKSKFAVDCAPSHAPTQTASIETPENNKSELLKKWEINKFPGMLTTREEGMRSCHAGPEEPECGLVVEVLPTTELYRLTSNSDAEVGAIFSLENMYSRPIVDALVAALGEIKGRYQLARDLSGTNFRFISQTLKNGDVKKFIVFSGYPGTRHFIDGVKYGVANVKVATLTASKQSLSQLGRSSISGIADAFRPRTIAGKILIFALALDTAEWISNGCEEVERLFAKWTTTLFGIAIGAALAPFIASALGGVLIGLGAPITAIILVVGAMIVYLGVKVGIYLDDTGVEDFFYSLYKKLKKNWASDLESII